MSTANTTAKNKNADTPEIDLEQLVADSDTGGRKPIGKVAQLMTFVAVCWSLFQLWYASPLPFIFNFGVFNDTEARSIHLAFALFLAFTAYPAFKSSPREYIPIYDWVLALLGAFAGAYLYLFYESLSLRPGVPITQDIIIGLFGIFVMLEATRRSLGWPMVIVAGVFIAFTFTGPFMPEVLQHKGASINRFVTQHWLTTEGVYGVALGVSTSFVFLFVLFGTLLDRAGAGNWMTQISVALLGHLRGGPAKVAVVSSGLNGVVAGSSISNVVSGGIFTIPLMKRTGLSGVKAGAIEAAASINGQIMPPVMGAAAFLMVEYVGLPYSEIIKHAFLPAVASYISLLYIVHLEALKIGSVAIPRPPMPWKQKLLRTGIGLSGFIAFLAILTYGIEFSRLLFGDAAIWVIVGGAALTYFACLWVASKYDDLALDDPDAEIVNLPLAWEVLRTGLDFFIPLTVLLWCLMVEMLSPGLSAFWGTVTILGIVATRKIILALMRRSDLKRAIDDTISDVYDGLAIGARNMTSIAVATATAGIIVGTVTLTGLGLMMTDFVEYVSGGNVFIMLALIALISLILGMGIPTTANYILVATLMAPVVVELGAQAGLAIPLIAVHLFVFYFGIMADITPPVGLASFAAAAISREDPLATGFQGGFYALRTAVLPFVFIFHPEILMIGVDSIPEAIWVVFVSISAVLVFAAASIGYFYTRSKLWETLALLLICFTMFRPDWWMDRVAEPYLFIPATDFMERVEAAPDNARMSVIIEGVTIEGEDVRKTVSLRLDEPGTAEERLRNMGLSVVSNGDVMQVTNVSFGSYARRVGIDFGFQIVEIRVTNPDRPSNVWPILIAFIATGLVAYSQKLRVDKQSGNNPKQKKVDDASVSDAAKA